jgi:hypothetical protein
VLSCLEALDFTRKKFPVGLYSCRRLAEIVKGFGNTWRRQTALNLMPHENMQQKKTGANVT